MKQKTHSGLKKRVRVKASGAVAVEKASKRHLLVNKSKRQKKADLSGKAVHPTKMQALRRLMPGKVTLRGE